jgi:hypothetical protein
LIDTKEKIILGLEEEESDHRAQVLKASEAGWPVLGRLLHDHMNS